MKKLSDDLWQVTMKAYLVNDPDTPQEVEAIIRLSKEKVIKVSEMPDPYRGFVSVLTDDDSEFVIKSSLMNFYIEVLQEPLTAALRKKVPGGKHV